MSYNTKNFRGEAHRSFRLGGSGSVNADDFLEYLLGVLRNEFKEKNVPANICKDTAKSGGLFGSVAPMLVISHPNPPSHYFDIGILLNGKVISFPLLGYSDENTRANKKEAATGLKDLFTRSADEFALQAEQEWEDDVIDVIMSIFDDE